MTKKWSNVYDIEYLYDENVFGGIEYLHESDDMKLAKKDQL